MGNLLLDKKNIKKRNWGQSNPEKIKQYNQRYFAKNKTKYKLLNKKWREENRQIYNALCRASRIKYKYGIDSHAYEKMFNKTGGRCYICNKHQDELTARLNIDHNHTNGKVRGLLCRPCNLAIGLLNDDPILLSHAINYLNE